MTCRASRRIWTTPLPPVPGPWALRRLPPEITSPSQARPSCTPPRTKPRMWCSSAGACSSRGDVGAIGDSYERRADAVADKVVAGESAEALLDSQAGAGQPTEAVQRAVYIELEKNDPLTWNLLSTKGS